MSESSISSMKFKKGYYCGKLKDGLPHGDGKLTFSSGTYYNGKWVNGERDGYGEIYYIPCRNRDTKKITRVYRGEWKNDKHNGRGMMEIYKENGTIESFTYGTWEDGRKKKYDYKSCQHKK